MADETTALARVEAAHRMLTEARTLPEVLTVLKMAEALQAVARLERLSLEAQNMAAEQAIRAKRKGGDMLREMPKNAGGPERKVLSDTTTALDRPATLPELGISRDQSSVWQRIAAIPEERFEEHIEETKAAGEELTTASVLRVAEEERAVVDIAPHITSRRAAEVVRSNDVMGRAGRAVGLEQWDAARKRADTVEIAISYADAIIRTQPMAVVRDLAGANDVDGARERLREFAQRAAVWAPAVLRELASPEERGFRLVDVKNGSEG